MENIFNKMMPPPFKDILNITKSLSDDLRAYLWSNLFIDEVLFNSNLQNPLTINIYGEYI
jgi:hypothetical protein